MLSRILGLFRRRSTRDKPAINPQVRGRQSATAHLYKKRPPDANGNKDEAIDGANDGFNPYDTGKFDRSASWERISKTQR